MRVRTLNIMEGRRVRKASSMEGLIYLLMNEKCGEVSATVETKSKIWPPSIKSKETGRIGTFIYSICFAGKTMHGKKIVFDQPVLEWYGSSESPLDYESRVGALVQTIFEAQRGLKKIEAAIPEITVGILGFEQGFDDFERYLTVYGDKADPKLSALFRALLDGTQVQEGMRRERPKLRLVS